MTNNYLIALHIKGRNLITISIFQASVSGKLLFKSSREHFKLNEEVNLVYYCISLDCV